MAVWYPEQHPLAADRETEAQRTNGQTENSACRSVYSFIQMFPEPLPCALETYHEQDKDFVLDEYIKRELERCLVHASICLCSSVHPSHRKYVLNA